MIEGQILGNPLPQVGWVLPLTEVEAFKTSRERETEEIVFILMVTVGL